MMRRPATLPIVCALLLTSTAALGDRKSTRLNSSHSQISYAVFCLKKKKNANTTHAVTIKVPSLSSQIIVGHFLPSHIHVFATYRASSLSHMFHHTLHGMETIDTLA